MTKRKSTKQEALVKCIKHLQERDKIATIWNLRERLPYFHDNIVPADNSSTHDLYIKLYKLGVSTGLCEVRWERPPYAHNRPILMTTGEYQAFRKSLPEGHQDRYVDYCAAVFILASAEHYQKRMEAKKASLAKRKKRLASTDVRQVSDTLKAGSVPMHEKSFYDRVAKRYDTPVVEDGDINMPQLPTSQEAYNAKTDAEIQRQLEDFFTDESPTTEGKPVHPEEASDPDPTGGEPLKTLHIDVSYTRMTICIAAGIFVGMIVSNLITLLFI